MAGALSPEVGKDRPAGWLSGSTGVGVSDDPDYRVCSLIAACLSTDTTVDLLTPWC